MIYMTLNQIREFSPCQLGWVTLLTSLGKNKADDEPIPLSWIIKSNGICDAIWCFRVNWFEHRDLYMAFLNGCVIRADEYAAIYGADAAYTSGAAVYADDAAKDAAAAVYADDAAKAAAAADAAADAAYAAADAAYAAAAAAYAYDVTDATATDATAERRMQETHLFQLLEAHETVS